MVLSVDSRQLPRHILGSIWRGIVHDDDLVRKVAARWKVAWVRASQFEDAKGRQEQQHALSVFHKLDIGGLRGED
jgi:hypothetical protein